MLHMDVRSGNKKGKLKFRDDGSKKKEDGTHTEDDEKLEDGTGTFKPYADDSDDDQQQLIPVVVRDVDQTRNMRKRSSAGGLPDV